MKPTPTGQKLRGGYYTPAAITNFLCTWAIRASTERILEPSCGDGSFLVAAVQRLAQLGASTDDIAQLLQGVELDPNEAQKAIKRVRAIGVHGPKIHSGDFFAQCQRALSRGQYVDVVIGNPPFIRYQNFSEKVREPAFTLMRTAGLWPSRLTNAWLPFVVASTLLLRPGGRIAMVLPAELLQVGYASELRNYLSAQYENLTLFTFRHLIFDDIQQEIVLLCGERGCSSSGDAVVRTVELSDGADLSRDPHAKSLATEIKSMNHTTEKWTQYFLSSDELSLIRNVKSHPKLVRLADVASVDVGIVTGMNEFFVLNKSGAKRLRLERNTVPLVTRSAHLQGILFGRRDFQRMLNGDTGALLLKLPSKAKGDLGVAAREYITSGERRRFHTGYKCRIRKPWYTVPSIWCPDAFLLRQIHAYPKLIMNATPATCTDTIHRVRFKSLEDSHKTVMAFLNSLTFAFSELLGRSYGGGVLELEPSEADSLPIPLAGAEALSLRDTDKMIRLQCIDSVLERNDTVLLGDGLGLSRQDILGLRRIWAKLRDRRLQRRVRAIAATQHVLPLSF